jgi:hypothetical protein
MQSILIRVFMSALLLACGLQGQSRGPLPMQGETLIAVVPMVGAGTFEDPKRPMFSRALAQANPSVSFRYVLSDDGQSAIVLFSAPFREHLADILQSRAGGVRVFERGALARSALEAQLGLVRRGFRLEQLLGVAVPEVQR